MQSNYRLNEITDYQQWSRFFLSVNKSNLTQSWAYGEAKMKSQNWKIERAVITENDKPIAIVQAFFKKFLFLKFVRVSYGPLWVVENPSLDQIKNTFFIIKKQWITCALNFVQIGEITLTAQKKKDYLFKLVKHTMILFG